MNNNFITEEELEKLETVEPAARPSGAPPEPNQNPFFRGTIAPVLQHDSNLVATQYKRSSGVPIRPLMPPSAGSGAQANAGSTGVSSNLIKPIKVQTEANTTAISQLQTQNFQGTWNAAVSYSKSALVDFAGIVYVSLQSFNLNNEPDLSPTFWLATGSESFVGAWNSATAYTTGQIVSVGSALYIAIANSTNQDPTTTTGFWQLLTGTSVYEGAWSSSTAYSVGQTVSYTDGNFYIAIAAGTNHTPTPTGSSFWTLLGTSNTLIGAYSGGTSYIAGNQVTNAGNIFQALQATTGNAPPTPPATNAFWQLIGPQDLGSVPDGSSRFGQTASGLSYRPTSNPLTATDAGSNATVSIASFTMRTSSKGDISINSGSVTALSYGTLYYIYYDDSTLAGGAVSFNATTTQSTALNGAGRFFVGSIITPVSGAPATTGNNDGGVGTQSGGTTLFLFGAILGTFGGATSINNINNGIDGNLTTFAQMLQTSAPSGANTGVMTTSQANPTSQAWTSLTLFMRTAAPVNNAGSTVSLAYSTDGSASFTNVYSLSGSTRALTTDSVSLPLNINLALVRVKMTVSRASGTSTAEADLYEAYVIGVQ